MLCKGKKEGFLKICEEPENAINCFLRTNIDYLNFAEFKLLVHKK